MQRNWDLPLTCVFLRSEYFRIALKVNTDVGKKKYTSQTTGFSHEVLSTAVDFIYGIDIPEDFKGVEDLKSLLHLADLFLMEDLKDAAGSRIGEKLGQENFMDTAKLPEKFRAMELSHKCDYTGIETSPKSWEVVDNFFFKCM